MDRRHEGAVLDPVHLGRHRLCHGHGNAGRTRHTAAQLFAPDLTIPQLQRRPAALRCAGFDFCELFGRGTESKTYKHNERVCRCRRSANVDTAEERR